MLYRDSISIADFLPTNLPDSVKSRILESTEQELEDMRSAYQREEQRLALRMNDLARQGSNEKQRKAALLLRDPSPGCDENPPKTA